MNYYEILEVSVNASKEVIKNAYRALIKKYHPDSYQGSKEEAEEKIKLINEAYETLIDDGKRLLYDYDNGFKIDPNAIELQDEETETKENINLKYIISKYKIAIIAICIIILFILAFIIGGKVANSESDEDEDEKNEKVVEDVKKSPPKNNYSESYITTYPTIQNENTTTPSSDEEEKTEDNEKEEQDTDNDENNIPENDVGIS